MNSNAIISTTDGAVRYNDLELKPFPHFKIEGDALRCSQVVGHLLHSSDPFAMIWRAKIREPLLDEIRSYNPAASSIVLLLLQDYQDRFVDWSSWCPALIDLLVYYVTQEADYDQKRLNEAISTFLAGWRSVLKLLDLPSERAYLRLLTKLPKGIFRPYALHTLSVVYQSPKKRRLLSHLKTIDESVIETIQLAEDVVTSHLLSIRTTDQEGDSLRGICNQIMRYRQLEEISPAWPFYGSNPKLSTLKRWLYELEFLEKAYRNFEGIRFPKPPLASVSSKNFCIQPIETSRQLILESMHMENCSDTYIENVIKGTHYFFRLTRPEEATVLLIRKADTWYPTEVRTYQNGHPEAATLRAIRTWAGVNFLEDEQYAFPF